MVMRRTYKAYCITPSFFSWLGNGTSRRGLPVTPNGGPLASVDGVTAVACGFEAEEEMHAVGPRRRGRSAEEGLANGEAISCGSRVCERDGGENGHRSASAAVDRVEDSIVGVMSEGGVVKWW